MTNTIIYSTFALTLLLLIGLFFFIRASVKARIEQINLVSQASEDEVLQQLKTYFQQRAYRVEAIDQEKNQVTFQGLVRPSWFLAIFLTGLAAVGLLSLGLVLSFVWSSLRPLLPFFTLVAPGAGVFYWQKAQRQEEVILQVDACDQQTLLKLTGHRDELKELERFLARG